jgi:hypothetical protein
MVKNRDYAQTPRADYDGHRQFQGDWLEVGGVGV